VAAPGQRMWGHLRDLELREYLIVVPIMAAILFIGIYPKPILSRIEPSVRNTINCVHTQNNSGFHSHPSESFLLPPERCVLGDSSHGPIK
jgi:NADH:ubiquinone oxidoreductase subunit 4 (subunit M)